MVHGDREISYPDFRESRHFSPGGAMLDTYDRKILMLLQRNADLSVAEIAEAVALSTTPCWRRIRRLQEQGFVRFHICALKLDLDDETYVNEVDALALLAKSLQNPEFLEREILLRPQMRDVVEAVLHPA